MKTNTTITRPRCDECQCFVSEANAYHDVDLTPGDEYAYLVTDCRNCGHGQKLRDLTRDDVGAW